MRDLITWRGETTTSVVATERPRALTRMEWPPNYDAVFRWRIDTLKRLNSDPKLLAASKTYYASRPAEFIMDWMDTYDPRKTSQKWMPFVFFEKQVQLVEFFESLDHDQESGLIEKCRDMGATWVACAYSIWRWLFIPNDAIGWGSRKEALVDKLGDADSIFEKMRLLINRLPRCFVPKEFNAARHATYMKLKNPENGSIISGEAGDNIGRGGRKSAQPLDTPVLTPSGWTQMGDIVIGDEVIGADGKAVKVIDIKDHGFRDVYRVEFSDGTSTESDLEHLWEVEQRLGKRFKKVASLEEIMKDYLYVNPSGQRQYRWQIKTVEPIVFNGIKKGYALDPYIVGALLGDGSVGAVPKQCPRVTSADQEVLDEISKLLPEGCALIHSSKYDYRIVDVRGRQGNKKDKKSRARIAVVKSGIAGMRSENKYIPDSYKFGSRNTRLAMLQGLMDTDGSASGGVASFHSTSEKLAKDVQFLVQSLGGTATHNVKPDKRGYRDVHVIHLRLHPSLPVFRLSRKLKQIRVKKQEIARGIIKIEKSRNTEVRCITVENKNGLYLVNHCIITHNCYFKDEAAHYERPDKIEAALGDNTNVQIDISSVNGLGNVFHRRAEQALMWEPGKSYPRGFVRKFIMDWRDHPAKTQEWYEARKAKAEREGMLHLFAQEVDRNYSAAVQNVIISHDWIMASVDAHLKVPYLRAEYERRLRENGSLGQWIGGLDVGDSQDGDRNALTLREWIIWRSVEEWVARDTGVTARMAIERCQPYAGNIEVMYDCIGVGAGVKTEYNRLTLDDHIIDPRMVPFVPWNAGAEVLRKFDRVIPDDDESPMNKDFYDNMKAQAWWSLRTRFFKTFKAVTEGVVYPCDDLISLDSSMSLLLTLAKELAQPTRGTSGRLKMIVDKKPDGTRSPNLADSGVQAFFPIPTNGQHAIVGTYG